VIYLLKETTSVSHQECPERIRLAELYSEAVSSFSRLIQVLKTTERSDPLWEAVDASRRRADLAWNELMAHIGGHGCGSAFEDRPAADGPEFMVIADDQNRFIDVGDAVTPVLGLTRDQMVGRRIDDFFTKTNSVELPPSWEKFVREGVKCGVCVTPPSLGGRKFAYRSKGRLAPGMRVCILREIEES
jgi:PAS domain-containing protein